MKKEVLDKAMELYSTIKFWESRINEYNHIISYPNAYRLQFKDESSVVGLEPTMNDEIMLPCVHHCIEYAEEKLNQAKKEFAKL